MGATVCINRYTFYLKQKKYTYIKLNVRNSVTHGLRIGRLINMCIELRYFRDSASKIDVLTHLNAFVSAAGSSYSFRFIAG